MSPKARYEMQFPTKPILTAILVALLIGYLAGINRFGMTPLPAPTAPAVVTGERGPLGCPVPR
ncbi:hypothetical protein HUO13_16340 [Saccharopolyspora erythraea]|uniref:hypothetical protein n=1 Tax=Saccharopolyspora erythraea TaxID=1836 RepID=UPI001BAA16F1|nr:hypothetical protein [Saccharopolyspora erythraea]QUH02152.1 hypothetical protein HUO13_16340 [Saccharopolyspora erythraea]